MLSLVLSLAIEPHLSPPRHDGGSGASSDYAEGEAESRARPPPAQRMTPGARRSLPRSYTALRKGHSSMPALLTRSRSPRPGEGPSVTAGACWRRRIPSTELRCAHAADEIVQGGGWPIRSATSFPAIRADNRAIAARPRLPSSHRLLAGDSGSELGRLRRRSGDLAIVRAHTQRRGHAVGERRCLALVHCPVFCAAYCGDEWPSARQVERFGTLPAAIVWCTRRPDDEQALARQRA